MALNTEKFEVAFFTSKLHEAQWQPTIHLEGQPLHFTSLIKLLGVTLDRALPFGQHIANITAKAAGRCCVLTSLTSKLRGLKKIQLSNISKALYLIVLMFGAPAWQPWLTATRLEQLERCQNSTLRVTTGQLQTTPAKTLRRETGICSITTLMRRQAVIIYKKAARFTSNHTHHPLLNSPVRHNFGRQS